MILRKVLLAIVLVVAICLCYCTAVSGLSLGNFKIPSYDEIEQQNADLDQQISELYRKNTNEFESKKTALAKAIKDYNAAKENYQAIAPTIDNIKPAEVEVDIGIKPYDVEFLLVKLGNYATDQGITILFNIIKSGSSGATTTDNSTEYYTMADIEFTLVGEYNSIIEFMYSIEGDDELRFEINDFSMIASTVRTSNTNNTSNNVTTNKEVQAKFQVKGIPINNSNLLNLSEPTFETSNITDVNNTTSGGINYSNPLNIDKNAVGGVSQSTINSMNNKT